MKFIHHYIVYSKIRGSFSNWSKWRNEAHHTICSFSFNLAMHSNEHKVYITKFGKLPLNNFKLLKTMYLYNVQVILAKFEYSISSIFFFILNLKNVDPLLILHSLLRSNGLFSELTIGNIRHPSNWQCLLNINTSILIRHTWSKTYQIL